MSRIFQAYKRKTEAAKKEYLKALAAYRASLVSKVTQSPGKAPMRGIVQRPGPLGTVGTTDLRQRVVPVRHTWGAPPACQALSCQALCVAHSIDFLQQKG